MDEIKKTETVDTKKIFTESIGNAFTSVGSGVKKSVSGTMDWIRNFFFKIWGMILLTILTIGALIVLLAFSVSILDGTTSFKRLCGDQSIVSCLSIAKDAPKTESEIQEALEIQSSPTQRSTEAEQSTDKTEIIEAEKIESTTDSEIEIEKSVDE